MLVNVTKIIPHDDDPDFHFIEVQVIFNEDHGDQVTPNNEAQVNVFLEKEDRMTRPEMIDAAIQKARQFLSNVVALRSDEYWKQSRELKYPGSSEEDPEEP